MSVPRKLAIVGTGVVGEGVLRAWKSRDYDVIGYDVNPKTISRLRADNLDVRPMDTFADCDAEMVFICISTPQSNDGSVFLDFMMSGLAVIGAWIASEVDQGRHPMIVMRSTMLPNLSRYVILPALEKASHHQAGVDFGYAHLPEILRETDALTDSLNIWQVVIGALDERTGDALEAMFRPVLGEQSAELISRVDVEVAEAAKVIVNTYNATIISYYNMMGQMLQAMEIDGQAAIDLAARMSEGSLNSWYGTVSGKPYGGKCLPKDVAAVLAMARDIEAQGVTLETSQLQATEKVNDYMIELARMNRATKPVKGGMRRMSARNLRRRALETYRAYHVHNQADPGKATPADGVAAAD